MYEFEKERAKVFTDDGLKMFTAIRDKTRELIGLAGAAKLGRMINGCGGGDTFTMQACIDLMVERQEIREVTGRGVAGQDRIFVAGSLK